MTLKHLPILFISTLFSIYGNSQVTNIVILDKDEITKLREAINTNENVKRMYDSIANCANQLLIELPRPLETIFYEGLLDNDPKRINTVKSFRDIDLAANLIYASYGNDNPEFGKKAKEILLAWANTYKSDGNTINENKLISLFWSYYRFGSGFSLSETNKVEKWMNDIAVNQMNRERTSNNNWEAKRLKIIGLIGCILKNEKYTTYSLEGFKRYISTAYFADGTSNDLRQRDALHYHIGGLKPCLSAFINLSKFDMDFELYNWESPSGSSIKKSVEYVIPYASGEKTREEWKNSKVELDKKRAATGLDKYQPGMLFDRKDAYPLIEWACYYNTDWYSILENDNFKRYTSSWIGLLNSQLIRSAH